MSGYSIEKKGSDFVVKSGQQDILKFASRRSALATVREAKAAGRTLPVLSHPAEPVAIDV